MKTNQTELVFILDRSGSMCGMEGDTIGGFNAMLEQQRALPGLCRITTVLFNERPMTLHDRLDVQAVRALSAKEYSVGGCTALLDAVGSTIHKIRKVVSASAEGHKPDKVMFVITTDGMENASHEYSVGQIQKMIETQKAEFGWEFLFLGANIDAVNVAEKMGIHHSRAAQFHNDSKGIEKNYIVLANTVSTFRMAECEDALPDQWADEIREDFESRNAPESA